MPTDGEKNNWQGERFSEDCENLVKRLHYQEKKTRTAGTDMFAVHNEDRSGLMRPFFSPANLTAFEFTTKGDTGDEEIEKFSKKVKGDVSGCVLVRNIKINDKILEKGKDKNVFCWDSRTVEFLSSKILLFNIWLKHGTTIEKKITNDITYIRCLEKDTYNPFQIRLAILSQDPLKDLGSEDIKKALDFIKDEITDAGISPCQIKIIVLTRSLPRKDLFNQIDGMLEKRSTQEMAFTTVKKPIIDFYTSPFSFKILLSESPDILM